MPSHEVYQNDIVKLFNLQGVNHQFFAFSGADGSTVTYDYLPLGDTITLADFGTVNANVTETDINLNGGCDRLTGTGGFCKQTGIKFTGFDNYAGLTSVDFVKAVDSSGGIFEWREGADGLFNVTETTLVDVPHSEVYNVTPNGYTLTISSLNDWYNFTGLLSGEMLGFTLGGDGLTAEFSGVYKMDYAVSFSGSGGSTHSVSALINDVEHTPCRAYRKLGTAGDVGNMGGTCLMSLNAGDVIRGVVNDISSPAQDIQVWSMNANLVRFYL